MDSTADSALSQQQQMLTRMAAPNNTAEWNPLRVTVKLFLGHRKRL